MDSLDEMLSMLLDGAVEVLDISPELHDNAVERYEEVGTWLAENGSPGWQIYPQGSFRLGTVVRPGTPGGEYDIDLVCRLPLRQESTTQERLKQRVGDQLTAYRKWKQDQILQPHLGCVTSAFVVGAAGSSLAASAEA